MLFELPALEEIVRNIPRAAQAEGGLAEVRPDARISHKRPGGALQAV